MQQTKRSCYIWFISATTLLLYGTLGLIGGTVPGVEDIMQWLSNAQGWQFYIAGFVAIMLEGLYVVGNFFPGTTTVLLLAVLSGIGGWMQFGLTILAIFLGWCVAGAVNIFIAHYWLRPKGIPTLAPFVIHDNIFLTWFPAFRANCEVAQIVAGGNLTEVCISAVRVRFFATIVAASVAALVMLFFDITELDNEEGFLSVLVIAAIMYVVGAYKLRQVDMPAVNHV